MYGSVQHSGRRTRVVGLVTAAAITVGAGYVFATGMKLDINPLDESKMEMVILTPPEPPPPVEEIKPVEVPEVDVAPAAPELVAPDIPFEIEVPPVIVAPVAEPVPIPDPVPATPAPTVGTDRVSPRLQAGQKPAYPSASLRANEQGTTHLEVCVSSAGRVTSVSVAKTSGFQRLDDAAAKWIRGERFAPGKIGGVAQSMCGHDVFYQWSVSDAK